MPKPLTREEMIAKTDNRFENPVSGVSAPSWKPDAVKAEKAEIAAEEAAAKAAEKLRVDTAEVTPRGGGGGGRNSRSGLGKKSKTSNTDATRRGGNRKRSSRSRGGRGR
jgi:hypothetical protein